MIANYKLNFIDGLTSCDACPLYKNGFVVPGRGLIPNRVMVIGEAPGENENIEGVCWVGAAGKKLVEYLALGGIVADNVYLTNSVKHWPGPGNPTPSKEVVRMCRGWLDWEIEAVDPDLIIIIGSSALTNILPKANIKRQHGRGEVVEIGGRARTIYTCYHPAAGLHNPGLVPIIKEDFIGIGKSNMDYHDMEVVWIKDLAQEKRLETGAGILPIAIDFETSSLDPTTCKVSAIGWSTSSKRGYTSAKFSPVIKTLFQNHIRYGGLVIAHNGAFDLTILQRLGVDLNWERVWDTMISGYILGKDLALKTRALRELNIKMETYSDIAGKVVVKDSGEIDPWKLLPYNACDAAITHLLYDLDNEEITNIGAQEGMAIETSLTPILLKMGREGIKFDEEKAIVLYNDFHNHLDSIKRTGYECVGHSFDINYSTEVANLLFEELGIEPIKLTKGKTQWSTDEEVLKTVYNEHPIVPIILEYRKYQKMVSTYVEGPLVYSEHDGRVHTTFKQTGARGGRGSSVNPNLQNQPSRGGWGSKIKALYLPDPHCVFIEWDYSQLELRVAAAMANDPVMIQVFLENRDIHAHNVRTILGKEPGNEDDRRLAKNIGFGMLYKMSASGLRKYLATRADPPILITPQEAKRLHYNFINQFKMLMDAEREWEDRCKDLGYAENLFHYRRYLPEIQSDDRKTVADACAIAVNLPIQGTAGVITKIALVEVARELPYLRLRNTVHDSILGAVSEKDIAWFGYKVGRIMEEVAESILGIPVKVEWKVGDNWGECMSYEKWLVRKGR